MQHAEECLDDLDEEGRNVVGMEYEKEEGHMDGAHEDDGPHVHDTLLPRQWGNVNRPDEVDIRREEAEEEDTNEAHHSELAEDTRHVGAHEEEHAHFWKKKDPKEWEVRVEHEGGSDIFLGFCRDLLLMHHDQKNVLPCRLPWRQ